MNRNTKAKQLPPLRVRHEPPTIEEAVVAARDLTDDIEQQIFIAAGLMGITADEARPHVLKAEAPAPTRRKVEIALKPRIGAAPRPTVVVERRRSRASALANRPN